MSTDPTSGVRVDSAELARRTVRRSDFVSCNQAFIDCRTPGSDRKENYSMIGRGVSQSAGQVVNLEEPHGYNIGAAAMPNGVVNNLHLHYTAEVFLCFRGEYLLRWGVNGDEGELLLREGDIASIPTWIFRGFTNTGPDDGWLFTVLGMDDTGGIIWGPSVLAEAARHGLYLSADNELIDTVADGPLPQDAELVQPLAEHHIAALRRYTPEQMRRRVAAHEELAWSGKALLDHALPGGGAELALVVGYGMTEDRDQEPVVTNPHGHSIAWLRAEPGRGVLRHRTAHSQVLMVKDGEWEVTLNDEDPLTVRLGHRDLLSVPAGAWRTLRNVSDGPATLVVVNEGDGRVRPEWDEEVVKAAADAGVGLDHNGYLAPYELIPRRR
ncbi:cupin domain-containing protein [Streptomyces sp. NPDC059740]|uniref:cupin domain-containing protein n=1 Tax=Streptomyces sp. NPDC059740 TaxID=3346926 RepID=UPI003653C598